MKKQFTLFLMLLSMTIVQAQLCLNLSLQDIEVNEGNLFFSIYLHTADNANGTLNLFASDFVLSYNTSNFSNPTFSKVDNPNPIAGIIQNGYCTFKSGNTGQPNADELMQMNYHNITSTDLINDQIFVNLNTFVVDSQADFDSNVAIIDATPNTHCLGRYVLTGMTGDLSNADLFWETEGFGFKTKIFSLETTAPYTPFEVNNGCNTYIDFRLLLPIELLSFSAERARENVQLTWSSQDEVDFEGFELQRSLDGELYRDIAWIPSKGNSTVGTNTYEFLDETAPFNQLIYYRLKMKNLDGSFAFSPIRNVRLEKETFGIVQLYPNPAQDQLHLVLTENTSSTDNIRILNTLGQVVLEVAPTAAPSNRLSINTSPLATGIYILEFQSGNKQVSRRFRKMN